MEDSSSKKEVKNAKVLTEDDLRYLLDEAQYGVLDDRTYIPLRASTPQFFRDAVYEHSKHETTVMDVPLASRVEHIRQSMESEDGLSYGEHRPHNLSADDIISISKEMGHPAYIVHQQNGRYAMVVAFYDGERDKNIIASIAFANVRSGGNYKYERYMNGYNEGYYNIVVTQFEPDNLQAYLRKNEVVYDKKKMNGKYQVGSGRIVTFTHDTPFINNNISETAEKSNKQNVNDSETIVNEDKHSTVDTTKITPDMSDEERAEVLNNKSIIAPEYNGEADLAIEANAENLRSEKIGLVKKAIVSISEQFDIIGKNISIEDVGVEITFSKSNLKESISKKATPEELVKLLPVLEDSVSHAIGIERHDNRYYFDSDTVYFENLLGGFNEGEYFIPVRFGLKHSKTGNATLYVVVNQNKIAVSDITQKKETEVVKTAGPNETNQTASRSVNYSISQIVPFVKNKDLLRYLPDNMLDAEQKHAINFANGRAQKI